MHVLFWIFWGTARVLQIYMSTVAVWCIAWASFPHPLIPFYLPPGGGYSTTSVLLDKYAVLGISLGIIIICACINSCSIRVVSGVLSFSAIWQVRAHEHSPYHKGTQGSPMVSCQGVG